MLLSDWYRANKERLEADGFDVEFLAIEGAEILRATGDRVCFDFTAKGGLYADFVIASDDEEKIGRIDEPTDAGEYFENVYRGEVLRLISG